MSGGKAKRGAVTVDQLLEEARAGLERLTPEHASAAMRGGAVLVDIRSETQRTQDGTIRGSRFIPRNVLEWRCDPASPWRDPVVAEASGQVIVICDAGYQSSLAAATLQRLGHLDATDVIGGFQAWRSAGLPVDGSGGACGPEDRGSGTGSDMQHHFHGDQTQAD